MTAVLGCIYGLGMLGFTVAFLVDWIRSRESILQYARAGVIAGLVILAFDVLIMVISSSGWTTTTVISVLLIDIIVFIRVFGFTMLGMHYCAELGYPSFILLFGKSKVEDEALSICEASANSVPVVDDGTDETLSVDVEPVLEPIQDDQDHEFLPPEPGIFGSWPCRPSWTEYALSVAGVATISIIYSVLLFLLTSPSMSEAARNALGVNSIESTISIQAVLFVLAYAVGEEIFFRLGIQNFLAKHLGWRGRRYWLAIVVTTLLWTLGHAGVMEPGWVKLAQIFPVGLMLGWLSRRYGVESSILAHGLFNVILSFPSSFLIN